MEKLQELASKYWLIVLVLVLGWFWLHEHDKAVAFQAQAKEQEKMLIGQTNALRALDKTITLRDSTIERQRQELVATNKKLEEQNNKTQATINTAINGLRESLDSAQKVQLDAVVDGYTTIIQRKDQEIAGLSRLLAQDSVQSSEKSKQLERYRQLNQSLLDQVHLLTEANRPTFSKTVMKILPWALTGAVLVTR